MIISGATTLLLLLWQIGLALAGTVIMFTTAPACKDRSNFHFCQDAALNRNPLKHRQLPRMSASQLVIVAITRNPVSTTQPYLFLRPFLSLLIPQRDKRLIVNRLESLILRM